MVGCPAHAGIDPHRSQINAKREGLPRPGGDRPQASDMAESINAVAPPTRG